MKRLVKLWAFALVLCLLAGSCFSGACAEEAALTISDIGETFEGGGKACRGAIKVVDLRGSWKEMGRQYGGLLAGELTEIYAFVTEIAEASDKNAQSVQGIVDAQIQQTPYTIRQFFAGMAETSGLTEPQLYMVNAVERIAGLPMCSAAAVWGDYAAGPLVFGRNYDYGEAFHALSDDVVVAVYHPSDGALAAATVGYAGEIYAVNGLNEKGIFLELNNGKPSANIKSPARRITGTTLLLDILFEADTLDYLDLFFETAMCSSSYIINVADGETARSYEWCPVGVKRGDGVTPEGLLASANHFVNPDWLFATPSDAGSWMSITRRNNLLALCEENKGQIDADRMMAIIETNIDDGGAMEAYTVYQMVVVPETLTLYLKVVGAAPWTEIDMNAFLCADR